MSLPRALSQSPLSQAPLTSLPCVLDLNHFHFLHSSVLSPSITPDNYNLYLYRFQSTNIKPHPLLPQLKKTKTTKKKTPS